ncbi:MAG: hypothetical protein ACI4E1_06700 [Lachnospira sp.]
MIIMFGDYNEDSDTYTVLEQVQKLGINYVNILNREQMDDKTSRSQDEEFVENEKLVVVFLEKGMIDNIDALYYMDVVEKLYYANKIRVIAVRCGDNGRNYPKRFDWLKKVNNYYINTESEKYALLVKIIYWHLTDIYYDSIYDSSMITEENGDDLSLELSYFCSERISGYIADILADYFNISDNRRYVRIIYMVILMRYIMTFETDEERNDNNMVHCVCNYIYDNSGLHFLCGIEEQYIMEICFLLAFKRISHYNYYA